VCGGWFGYFNVLSGGWYVEEHPVCIELTVFRQFVYKMCLGLFLQALWLEQTVNMTYHIYLSHSTTDPYRFPRVFGDEFGDEFGDSLNFVSKLVTHLVMISVNHCIW